MMKNKFSKIFVSIALFAILATNVFADRTFTLPNQNGNAGKFLSTDGTKPSWEVAGGGSITSFDTQYPIINVGTSTAPIIGIDETSPLSVYSV